MSKCFSQRWMKPLHQAIRVVSRRRTECRKHAMRLWLDVLEDRTVPSSVQAIADTYTAVAGVPLTVPTAQGILSNDVGTPIPGSQITNPPVTIISPLTTGTPQTGANLPAGYVDASHTQTPLTYTQPLTTTTAEGGTVTLNPDGSFNYVPPANFTGTDSFNYTITDAVQDYKTDLPVQGTFNGVPLTAGGFGSSLYPVPSSSNEFYGLEDRGPNATAANGNIVEPLPNYDPAIGKFKFVNGQAILEAYIPLKAADGTPYSGRVNSQNPTGETLVDLNGNVQPQDPNGYDSEGLVALPDGTFWVSDEYGPFITHFDATGKEIGRLSPLDGTLPAELQNRVINRGMEGLTITPDGTMLVGMMQSALQQPDIGTTNAKKIDITRLITYQLVATPGSPVGTVHEYLYQLDNPGTNATANSELTALDDTHFLVDERDGNFAGEGTPYYKKLWEIDITGATDVGPNSPLIGTTVAGGTVAYDSSSTHLGLTIGGKSLEKLLGTANTAAAFTILTNNGITPVNKGTTPYVDIGALITALDPTGHFFSHDKIEGVAVINGGTQIVISNDSDFNVGGVNGLGAGNTAPYQLVGKDTLNAAGVNDDGEFLVINLNRLTAGSLPASTSTATVTINVIPPTPGATLIDGTLYLIGGNTNDQVQISSAAGGIAVMGKLNGTPLIGTYNVSAVVFVGYNGNDNLQVAKNVAIPITVIAGNGNDNVQLGDGNNIVMLGNGNDNVQLGDGNNSLTLGNGNNQVQAGNGANNVTVATGNNNINLGNGDDDSVSVTGNGNNHVQMGNGSFDVFTLTGNGNNHVQMGDGSFDVFTLTGNGNNNIQIGDGLDDFFSLVGDGNNSIKLGIGSGKFHLIGDGHNNVKHGSGWTEI